MDALCRRSASVLSRLLASGEVGSEELTRAHLARIEAVDPKVRAFVTVTRAEAIATARRADSERRRGKRIGPLQGLPVTIKESIELKGYASTLGAKSRRELRATEDAGIVEALREAGAVILGRTNVSQLLLFHESRNPLFGQTANPWSLTHTPGGSSGGEAAAIAAGMSPLGIGTDIGGSIRVPAHFSGIAGLKPTLDRWTNKGSTGAMLGQEGIRSQLGPMARSARDLAMAMGALDPKAMTAIDPRVPPLAFEDPARVDLGKLVIGVLVDDGLVPPSLAVARAVREAAGVLRERGAEVREIALPGIEAAVYDYFAALSADGGATAFAWLEGETIDASLDSLRTLARLPAAARRAASAAASAVGEKRVRGLLDAVGEKSVAEYWAVIARLRRGRAAIVDAWRAAGVDLVLCPAHATPALPHGLSRDFALAGSASMLWNLTQFPAGVVPVTRVRPAETVREAPRDRLEKRAAEVDARSAGLPVGVQVVGRPWEEDTVLAAMIAIEDGLARSKETPRPPNDRL